MGAHIKPSKRTFSADYISALGGAAPSNFLHALQIDQLDWGPLQKFNRENLKFDLKFSVRAPIISG